MPGKSRALQAEEEQEQALGFNAKSQYQPGFARRAQDYCMLGATNAELAELFEVTERTIEKWMVELPRFKRCVQNGRTGADVSVSRALHRRATGMKVTKERAMLVKGKVQVVELKEELPPDTNAASLWLANRQRSKWRASTAGDGAGQGFDLAAFVAALRPLAQPAAAGSEAKPVAVDVLDIASGLDPAGRSDDDEGPSA